LLGGDIAGRARANLDHELLAEMLGKKLGDEPRGNIGGACRRLPDDHLDRPRRIIEPNRAARRDWHRGKSRT
jgi:hypothetical protein